PDLHHSVPTAGGQAPAVRAERHGGDGLDVAAQGEGLVAGGQIPDLHRTVAAGGRESPTVGAEGQGPDPGRMMERQRLLPGASVPDLHRPFDTARGELPAVRAERDAIDGGLLLPRGVNVVSRSGVAGPDRSAISEGEP